MLICILASAYLLADKDAALAYFQLVYCNVFGSLHYFNLGNIGGMDTFIQFLTLTSIWNLAYLAFMLLSV